MCIILSSIDIRPPRRCLVPSRWSLLKLPLSLCSKLERNPGGALSTAEHMPHLHLQRFKNRWSGSSPPTLYTPPVKSILAGEPVPELLIQSKYETSCTSEVHSHASNVYFYLCHSRCCNFFPFLLFYDGKVTVIKIDSLRKKIAWTAHREMC